MSFRNYIPAKTCCMVLRINLDCNSCCKKARRIILTMKEVETHMIEKQQCRISVCGVFRPSDVAIKLRKKMTVELKYWIFRNSAAAMSRKTRRRRLKLNANRIMARDLH